jgi:uncharacterized membrane protein YkgB
MNFQDIDTMIATRLHRHGLGFLRRAVAIIFIWFGFLKLLGLSPAAELVTRTAFWADPHWFIPFLGLWEIAIGLAFLIRPLLRVGIALLAPQMVGTFLPLLMIPAAVFQNGHPLVPTLEGQYIIKNLLIIGSAMVIGATVRQATDSAPRKSGAFVTSSPVAGKL